MIPAVIKANTFTSSYILEALETIVLFVMDIWTTVCVSSSYINYCIPYIDNKKCGLDSSGQYPSFVHSNSLIASEPDI